MDAEKLIYKRLPPTTELVELLTPPKKITRLDRWNRVLLGVMIFAGIVIVGCIALVKSDWMPKHQADLVSLVVTSVAVLAWIASVMIDLVQSSGTLLNPAKELAEQFDCDMEIESRLLPFLQAIPAAVLAARHQRLESQLQVWEKWLDTARLIGLLGPPFIFITKGAFSEHIPLNGAWNIEIMFSALLTGVLLGTISFRSGMKRLHRVSSLLKRAAEQRQATTLARRHRGKK